MVYKNEKQVDGSGYELIGIRLCLYLALKKLEDNDLEMAKHRAEEAIKLIEELQLLKIEEGRE